MEKKSVNIGGATASNYTANATGTYKVVITNFNGCSRTSNAITVTGPPPASIVANGLLTFCAGDSVILSANSGTGYSYQRKKGNGNIGGATNINYTAKNAGTYKAVVTDSYSCSKISNSKTVVVNCRLPIAFDDDFETEIFPNPSHNYFTLALDNTNDENIVIRIYNILGEENTILNNFKANTPYSFGENLPSGIYFLEIQKGNKTKRIKIVKI